MVSQTLNNKRSKYWYIATGIIFLDIIHHLAELSLLEPTEWAMFSRRNKTMDNVPKYNTCDEQYID